MTSIQAGYSAQAANLNLTSSAAESSQAKIGNWLAQTGGGMAADAIRNLDVPQDWKDKALQILAPYCMPPEVTAQCNGPSVPAPGCTPPVAPMPGCPANPELPCCGTPSQEGDAMRQLDDLKEAFNKFFQEVMQLVGKGGSEESESARNSRAVGASGDSSSSGGTGGSGGAEGADPGLDFFTAFAHAIGRTLQNQADTVKKLSTELMNTSDAETNAAASGSTGDAGLTVNGTSVQTADSSAPSPGIDPKVGGESSGLMDTQTRLAAESMKMNFMSTGLQTALKAVSDSLNTMARA